MTYSLQKAKKHVQQEYATVGMLEDLQNFFKTLEYIFSKPFHGAYQVYLTYDKKRKTGRHATQTKIFPQPSTTKALRSKLKYEIEFYRFIQQRFYAVLHHINEQVVASS